LFIIAIIAILAAVIAAGSGSYNASTVTDSGKAVDTKIARQHG